jgi:hypothetical protein
MASALEASFTGIDLVSVLIFFATDIEFEIPEFSFISQLYYWLPSG